MKRISAQDIPGSKEIGSLADGACIYQVSGSYVRDEISVEWVAGGHYQEDDFIAESEIWVEEMDGDDDQKGVIAHEIVEYLLMTYANEKYPVAHEMANSAESIIRGNDGTLNDKEEKKGAGMGKALEPSMLERVKSIVKMRKAKGLKISPYSGTKGLGIPAVTGGKKAVPKAVYEHSSKLGAGAAKRRAMLHARPAKVAAVMHEFKKRSLHSGGGGIVKNRKQAIAIALSEARGNKPV